LLEFAYFYTQMKLFMQVFATVYSYFFSHLFSAIKSEKILRCALWILLSSTIAIAQTTSPPFLNDPQSARWADSVIAELNIDQQIAQLIMVAAFSNRGPAHTYEMSKLIENHEIGGLIFFQGGPVRQAKLHNHYQSLSKIPLLVAMDAEWGVSMRLDSTLNFPYQMTLGAISDDNLIEQMGERIAHDFKRLGMHVNFAPVIDVNNNAANPVINYRAFGEQKGQVAQKGLAYMQGMQQQGILATGKHFPGHGDTDVDSHYDLPVITHDTTRLQTLELYPFRQLFAKGLGSVMVAHLQIPAWEPTPNRPSTLSTNIVTHVLQQQLGFEGIVFTDALNMKGVTKYYEPGIVDVEALKAGNDILLYSEDVPKAIEEIKKALELGQLDTATIYQKCHKMLRLKGWSQRYVPQMVETKSLIADLNSDSSKYLIQQLGEAAVTLLKNDANILPLKRLDTLDIAAISIGKQENFFQPMLSKFTRIHTYHLSPEATQADIDTLKKQLSTHNLFIVGLHQVQRRPNNVQGVNTEVQAFITEAARHPRAIISVFRNPYTLAYFPEIENSRALIMSYESSHALEEAAAQLIFGAIDAKGKLPVSIAGKFEAGTGLSLKGGIRLKYTRPAEVGWDGDRLEHRLDSIVHAGIAAQAYPGAQLLVAKSGNVIFHKAYGYHTYDSLRAVELNDLYDFASVTKITGTLPGIMKLHGEDFIDLDAPFSIAWPDWKRSDKRDLTWREILAHQAQLKPWIPYWEHTLKDNGKFKRNTFRVRPSEDYPIQLTGSLYQHKDFKEKKIFKMIRKSDLNEEPGYVYSGLAFYIFPTVIENLVNTDYESFTYTNFYDKLGAHTLRYNPWKEYDLSNIIPTERDTFFRMEQIHGRVHDEGAVMMEGVSGNAGLFGTSLDLAKLMQMYMNQGSYGGEQYIASETVEEFTRYQYRDAGNRRGLGFDKPPLENKDQGYIAPDASEASFGHSGYTGTFTWADPQHELLIVFFCNRVYPTRLNRKLYDLNIRPSLHQTLYDMIKTTQGDVMGGNR